MNIKCILAFSVAAMSAAVAFADEDDHPVLTTIPGAKLPRYFGLSSVAWRTEGGEDVAWSGYNDGNAVAKWTERLNAQNSSTYIDVSDVFSFYGMIVAQGGWFNWFQGVSKNGVITPVRIGAGGVDVGQGGDFFFSTSGGKGAQIQLTANQTWTGSGTSASHISIGGNYTSTIYDTRLIANEGVTDLILSGKLYVGLSSPSNDLSAATVTVRDLARIYLSKDYDARLNAKKLVLEGDGDHLVFGGTIPWPAWHSTYNSRWASGAIDAIDNEHLAETVELKDGADISATGGIWGLDNLMVSGSGESVISGSLVFTNESNRITFATAGAALRFDTVNVEEGVSAGFIVDGPGVLTVTDFASLSGPIELLNGATLVLGTDEVARFGSTIGGSGTIEVVAGTLYLSEVCLTEFTGDIVVAGGTLVLDHPLAEGRVTVSDGEVLYGDAVPLAVVTDAVRSEPSLSVDEGTTLRVLGDGLTAATSLTMNGGVIRFECDATVASAVSVTAPSYFETAAETVTGTFSGFITSSIPYAGKETTAGKGLRTRGAGCIKLTGGGSFNGYKQNPFFSEDGSVWFAGGNWNFRNCGDLGMCCVKRNDGPYGKKWTVSDGAKLKLSGYNSAYNTYLRIVGKECSWDNTVESVLEVCDGGEIEFAENAGVNVGFLQAQGRFRILDGGKVRFTNNATSYFSLGNSVTTTGIFELESGGILETAVPFSHPLRTDAETYQTQGRIVWNGGTIKLLSNYAPAEASLFRHSRNTKWDSVNNSLRIWVKIMGEDCTLDLTDLPERETPLANVPAGMERSEWFGTGTLTVKGGKPFVFQSFPNGINLKIEGAGTQVILPENVEIHDYETCLATEIVNPGQLHYTTLDKCLQNLALASFTAEGAAGSFVCQKTDCKVTIAETRAAEGGEFVNGMLAAAGGLEVGALTFAENSIVCGDPAAAALAVTGDITLPASLRYAVRKTPGTSPTFTAFTAGGALVGSPSTLIPEPGMKSRQVVIDALAKSLGFSSNGLLLLLK